jgi:Sigma-70, region 4
MVRVQLVIGILLSLVLAGSAFAQAPPSVTEGSGDIGAGNVGSGNARTGSGEVTPAPTARPRPNPAPAPAPAATRAPAPTAPRPTPAPAAIPIAPTVTAPPKQAKRTQRSQKRSSPTAGPTGCLLSREKAVVQRRAAGESVAQIARAFDISRARVRVLQRRAVSRLLSSRGACDENKRDAKLTTAAQTLRPPQASQQPVASSGSPKSGRDLDLTIPKSTGPSGMLLLLLGVGILLVVVAVEMRRQRGLLGMWAYRVSRRPFRRS